jgi:hypothetical protein
MTGRTVLLNAPITTTATPYTAGDSIGGLILQTPGQLVGTGNIESLLVVDASNQGAAFNILLFKSRPTGTYTDNAPISIAAGDNPLIVGVIGIAAADYVTIGSEKMVDVPIMTSVDWNMPRTVDAEPYPTLFMVIVAVGTPQYGANSTSLFVTLGLDADRAM